MGNITKTAILVQLQVLQFLTMLNFKIFFIKSKLKLEIFLWYKNNIQIFNFPKKIG